MKNKKEIVAFLVVQKNSGFIEQTKSSLEINGFLVYVYDTAESLFLSLVSKKPKIVFISNKLPTQVIQNSSSRLKVQFKINVVSLNEQLEKEKNQGLGSSSKPSKINKSEKKSIWGSKSASSKKKKRSLWRRGGDKDKSEKIRSQKKRLWERSESKNLNGVKLSGKKDNKIVVSSSNSSSVVAESDKILIPSNKSGVDLKTESNKIKAKNNTSSFNKASNIKIEKGTSFKSTNDLKANFESSSEVNHHTHNKKSFENRLLKNNTSNPQNKTQLNKINKKSLSKELTKSNDEDVFNVTEESLVVDGSELLNNLISTKQELEIEEALNQANIKVASGNDQDDELKKEPIIESTSVIEQKNKVDLDKTKKNEINFNDNKSKTQTNEKKSEKVDIASENHHEEIKPQASNKIISEPLNKSVSADASVVISKKKEIINASKKEEDLIKKVENNLNLAKVLNLDDNFGKKQSDISDCYLCGAEISDQNGYLILQTDNKSDVDEFIKVSNENVKISSVVTTKIDKFSDIDDLFIGVYKVGEKLINAYFISMKNPDKTFNMLEGNHEIDVQNFNINDTLDFPLFLYLKNCDKKIKYISKGSSFLESQIKKLIDNKERLYFNKEDEEKVLLYLQLKSIEMEKKL